MYELHSKQVYVEVIGGGGSQENKFEHVHVWLHGPIPWTDRDDGRQTRLRTLSSRIPFTRGNNGHCLSEIGHLLIKCSRLLSTVER